MRARARVITRTWGRSGIGTAAPPRLRLRGTGSEDNGDDCCDQFHFNSSVAGASRHGIRGRVAGPDAPPLAHDPVKSLRQPPS
jgi:hypothetical protein